MSKVVNFVGLGHINIVVDNIDNGIEFYQTLFGAEPYQIFRDFCNEGFSKAAGFLDDPKSVKLNIAFMEIPGTKLILELMEYINPEGKCKIVDKTVADMAGVRHVALKVEGIEDGAQYPGGDYDVSFAHSFLRLALGMPIWSRYLAMVRRARS